jgi:DNA-binding transcriptional ArsR family regulator
VTPTEARVGSLFGALADDTRRRVLDIVAASGSVTATEIAGVVPVTRQAVAKHLAVLHAAGLVELERSGRETRYRVVPGSLRPAGEWIASTEAAWAGRLGRLQRHVEGRSGRRTTT